MSLPHTIILSAPCRSFLQPLPAAGLPARLMKVAERGRIRTSGWFYPPQSASDRCLSRRRPLHLSAPLYARGYLLRQQRRNLDAVYLFQRDSGSESEDFVGYPGLLFYGEM